MLDSLSVADENGHGAMLTPLEVGARLALAKSSVYDLLQHRRLPHFRFGRTLRVRETDLAAFVEARRIAAVERLHPARPYARYPEA